MSEMTAWHSLSTSQTMEILKASEDGLGSEEVEKRLREIGPNVIPESPPKTLLKVFLNQFRNTFIYLLMIVEDIAQLLARWRGEAGDFRQQGDHLGWPSPLRSCLWHEQRDYLRRRVLGASRCLSQRSPSRPKPSGMNPSWLSRLKLGRSI